MPCNQMLVVRLVGLFCSTSGAEQFGLHHLNARHQGKAKLNVIVQQTWLLRIKMFIHNKVRKIAETLGVRKFQFP